MLPTIAPFLFVVVTATLIVVGLMFLGVGFEGRECQSKGKQAKPTWRPPLATPNSLRHWAKELAAAVARKNLDQHASPRALVEELYAGSSLAMYRSDSDTHLRHQATLCREHRYEAVGVTAPEALAIAEEIKSLPERQTRLIRKKAADNLIQVPDLTDPHVDTGLACPLLMNDGTCAVYALRPLHCRTMCSECGDHEIQPTTAATMLAIRQGITEGLTAELAAQGADDGVYELNNALSLVLRTPDAAERWSCGEPVFDGCASFEL